MIDINELREAIQTFGSQAINESDLNELLDRLELTESREAVYKKAFEISEKTAHDLTEKVIPNIRDQLETAEKERDELRAKIEAIEKQKPIAWISSRNGFIAKDNKNHEYNLPLIHAFGAQPTPSIPEGWKLVPTAESRHPGIYKMLGALHTVDNTPGASEWESYAAFLAAAPEVKL